MTERETNIRSVLFLVIGILLLLSLVICIYIVSSESDLQRTEAEVLEVVKDADGTGKNDVTVAYDVDGTTYKYNFYYKKDIEVGDFVKMYYHQKNATSVTTFKTKKIIFVCPIIGLILCILGIFELFKKNDESSEELKTSVIGVVGNTQQLKIVTNDTPVKEYVKTPEEEVETQVKIIKKENDVVPLIETTTVRKDKAVAQTTSTNEVKENKVITPKEKVNVEDLPIKENNKEEKIAEKQDSVKEVVGNQSKSPVSNDKVTTTVNSSLEVKNKEAVTKQEAKQENKEEIIKSKEKETVEDAVMKKVKDNIGNDKKSSIDEEDIKKVIKDVVKEVILEVSSEKESEKKVVQKKVLPNYYHIAGTTLIYEEPGKEAKEISLKTIKSVVRTVNSAGSVVKLVVSNDEIKCVLTNMKNIDLEQVANLLHNKMRTIDERFEEVIEHKEY